MKRKMNWGTIYLVVVLAILYLPIFYLMGFSFSAGDTMEKYEGFSWVHYQTLFQDTRMITIVINTLIVALLSSLIATVIGTLGALAIKKTQHTMRNTLLSFNNVLMVSPDVIIGASFLILFTVIGMKLGFGSVLLSHIAFSIPIVVLMVLPKIDELSPTLLDAAADLGASPWQSLTRIMLPAISPGIMAGYFMAFTYSLDDFAVTFFVTGNGFSTLSVEIYSRARKGIDLEVNALSTLMFLVSLALVIGYYFISKRGNGKKSSIVTVKEGDVQWKN